MKNPFESGGEKELPGVESEGHPQLEAERAVGDAYVALIRAAIGNGTLEASRFAALPDAWQKRWESLTESLERHGRAQHEKVEAQKLTLKDLLLQGFKKEDVEQALADSEITIEEPSVGIYVLRAPPRAFEHLYKQAAQAVAVKIPDGVSYCLCQEHPEDDRFNDQLGENIPHEVHHVIWSFWKKDGLVGGFGETDPDVRKGFEMFLDELVAKLSSRGPMMAYTHLTTMSPEAKRKFIADKPDTYLALQSTTIKLNELLYEEIAPALAEQQAIRAEDLIMCVMEAKSFMELEEELRKMKALIVLEVNKNRTKNDASV